MPLSYNQNVTTVTDVAAPKADVWRNTFPWPPAWVVLLGLLLCLNLKNVPFIWHLRIVNALSYVLRSQRPTRRQALSGVFDTVITESSSPLAELDFNLHKSNSTYFSDLDIARAHLTCTLFNPGIEAARFAVSSKTIGGGDAQLASLLAGASCTFKREIKPYQRYEMWSRLLTWDHKWLWIVTHFVERKKCTDEGQRKIFATAISKVVWKKGRLTVSPEAMLKLSGLLPEAMPASQEHDAITEQVEGEIKLFKTLSRWTTDDVEAERQRGMQHLNDAMSLDELNAEFHVGKPVLAKREGLDFSLMLVPRIFYLFFEWVLQRLGRMVSSDRTSIGTEQEVRP